MQPGATNPPMEAVQGATPNMMEHHQATPQQAYASGVSQPESADEVRTIFIGDLQHWMQESYIHGCFGHTGEVLNVKIIRNKATGQSNGFIEFNSHAAAERILKTHNGQLMPGAEQNFRLNWASFGPENKSQDDNADDFRFVGVGEQQDPKATCQTPRTKTESVPDNTTIFVDGFDADMTEELLGRFFSPFGELSHVHIPLGKRCGFVKFVDGDCAEEALLILNGYPSGPSWDSSEFQLSWANDFMS